MLAMLIHRAQTTSMTMTGGHDSDHHHHDPGHDG